MFTLGADIEYFVRQDGEIVSVKGMIGGSKQDPRPCKDGALQEDGILCEINIDPIELKRGNAREWLRRIRSVESQAKELIGLELDPSPKQTLSPEILHLPECQVLGCDPDRNLYSRRENPIPLNRNYRTTGGHIHIGMDTPIPAVLKKFIVAIDQLAMREYSGREEEERRGLYGRYGDFRIKPYGVESRVLSSSWTRTDEEILNLFHYLVGISESICDIPLKSEPLQSPTFDSYVEVCYG